jgi:choline dehydrogenase
MEPGADKMGKDAMSVVDAELKVSGIDNLCVTDGWIMSRVTTGNTMAPCVVIGLFHQSARLAPNQ